MSKEPPTDVIVKPVDSAKLPEDKVAETCAIPGSFMVVGRREWLEGKIVQGAITPEQRVEIGNPSDLRPIKEVLDKQRHQGFDVLTIGANPVSDTSKIALVQYGTQEMVYLIEPALIPEFKDQLQSEAHLKIGHKIGLDYKFILSKSGFPLVRMYDTMLAEQLLTAGLEVPVGLKDLARRYAPHHDVSGHLRDDFNNLCEDDKFTKEMLRDGALNLHVLFPVFKGQCRELKEHGLEIVAKDEFCCIPVTADMELTGISLDEQILLLNKSFYEELQVEINEEAQQFYNDATVKNPPWGKVIVLPRKKGENCFNINSWQEKLNALRDLGYKVDNVRKETLGKLDGPFPKLLLQYSAYQKIASTYIRGLLRGRNPQGIYHPEFHQMGQGDDSEEHEYRKITTATGRYSSFVQQIPGPETRYGLIQTPEELSHVQTVFAERLQQGIGTSCTGKGEPTSLGEMGGKEYYLFPADDKHPEPYLQWKVPNIREAFRARPGYKLLIADYSQIEVKIMAELSGDPWLTVALNSGLDLHSLMASEIHGIPYDEFYNAYKNRMTQNMLSIRPAGQTLKA